MEIKKIANIARMQDGAIWDKYLFRFGADGLCIVYDMDNLGTAEMEAPELCRFWLDKIELIKPHSNAVVFGSSYYAPEDEFPLLYSNIYNNYARAENQMVGVCCVYRIQRIGNRFTTTLVQMIQVGFIKDGELWYSSLEKNDIRPFGNFVVDRENKILYAFTMRDAANSTRYFSFRLPDVNDGAFDEVYGVNCVNLSVDDILEYFDCEYHNFLQGAVMHSGKIYSVEGFTVGRQGPPSNPALRVISPADKRQELRVNFEDFGLTIEPEFIDFRGDTCYYGDGHGNLYVITF